MSEFEKYVARYSEAGVQAILEQIERCAGVHTHAWVSLQDRWETLMKKPILSQKEKCHDQRKN